MSVLGYLPYFSKRSASTYVAQEIVDTCLPILTSSLEKTAGSVSTGSAEYIGYVRARAGWLVDNAVDEIMVEFQVRTSNRQAICMLAVEQLVDSLLEEPVCRAA